MRALQAIILAAGGGTRMKSDTPKVLHAICGRPMIAYALDLAAASGARAPAVVLGESADVIKPHLPKEAKAVIQKSPVGTGDAVLSTKRALGGLSGDVLILYADTPLLRRTTIQRLIETHAKSDATCTLLTAHLADPTGYGRIVRDATGAIVGVVEEAEANAQQRAIREINVGPICAKAQPLFEALSDVAPSAVKKEWYLTQALSLLAQREGTKFQTVRIEEASEALGVNSRADLMRAGETVRKRILEAHLHNGVTIVDPDTTFIDHGVTIGTDTTIHPCTVIESGVSIGKRCVIGPFARLRRGVTLDDEVRVGNFVELVRTTVGHRVRMQHVSYLGDATVEDDVNIGAGTITANFDGTQKLPTTIGKGAFIGCDTILIAPVKVGAGAVTGAGSVIPKAHDVPPRGVVVGVPAHLLQADGAQKAAPRPVATPQPVRKPVAHKKAVAKRPVSKKRPAPPPAPTISRRAGTRLAKKKTTAKRPGKPRKPTIKKPTAKKASQRTVRRSRVRARSRRR